MKEGQKYERDCRLYLKKNERIAEIYGADAMLNREKAVEYVSLSDTITGDRE